jgi:hypothetical protein
MLLVLSSSLRHGLPWAGPALLDRLCFVLLTLATFWYFRRNRGSTGWIVRATGVATSFVTFVGVAQALGWQPLSYLTAGDQRSAFFGNVNMTAQFLGFAVILLMTAGASASQSRALAVLHDALLALSFAYLYLLSCRSVFLALGIALVLLLATKRLTIGSLARTLGVATLAVLLLPRLESALRPLWVSPQSTQVRMATDKAASTAVRLEVWRATLDLILDHPLGVGSANFGEAFIPYQLGLETIPGEAVLFRTPHNEYLRTVAEEGIVFAVLVGWFLFSLLRRLSAAPQVARGRSDLGSFLLAGMAFFAVEAFFQFPFGTAVGCLMAALLLGLALAALEPAAPSVAAVTDHGTKVSWRVLGTMAAAAVFVLLGCVVASELLFVNGNRDLGAQKAACRLNPRNLPACVTAAWLHAGAGNRREARAGLVRILRRSPYYHPAIRTLGEIAAADGDNPGACLYLWTYDQLFRGRSPVHSRLPTLCGNAPPAGGPPGVNVPYYRRMPLTDKDAAVQ